ncbi:MAG TPA: mechanosensitive ion channel family protein [Polyangiaceae bacterium]|nr:mechanosensitive ion channel family protein [Polyangiaceae bacterium]
MPPKSAPSASAVAPASASASAALGASAAPPESASAEVAPEPEPPPPAPAPEPVASAPSAPSAAVNAPAPSASVSVAPSASAEPAVGGIVRLGDAPVFTLIVPRGNKTPEVRAREASDALQRAFNADKNAPVSVRRDGDSAVILIGQAPIVLLTGADSDAAGESTLDVYAATVAAKIKEALDSEGRRAAIAKSVFSISLSVFFGLIAFYLIRKIGEFEETARKFIDDRSDRDLSIKIQKIEVVRPATLRSSSEMAIILGRWLGQAAIVYAWLVVVLSLFEATRNYTQRLTGFVLAPVSQLAERLASTLPMLVVASIAALAVFVLVRFVGLFFASVARGETPLPWLPADFAGPTSVLLRSAIVVAALVFAAPVVTGDANGALARAGGIIFIALGLASTPLLASGLVGATVLFGRRLRLGEFAEVSGTVARISAINLLEIRLQDAHHTELRVPHLVCLFRPLRVLGMRPRLSVDVPVAISAPQDRVREILTEVGRKCGHAPELDLLRFDADAAHYRLSVLSDSLDGKRELARAALSALTEAGIALGRTRTVSE